MCKVCEHPQRIEIERALLRLSPTDCEQELSTIAEGFNVSVSDLKLHSMLHLPLGINFEEQQESIAQKIKKREANVLEEVMNEYLITLKNVGMRINKYATEGEDSVKFEKLLTKPVSDLYIGLGSEIRQTAKAIADIDQILNGPKNDDASGLAALAAAIMNSK